MADMIKSIAVAKKSLLDSAAALEKQAAHWYAGSQKNAKDFGTAFSLTRSQNPKDVKKGEALEKQTALEAKRAQVAIKKLLDEWDKVEEKLKKTLSDIEFRAADVKNLHDEHRKLMEGLVKGLKAALQQQAEERHRALLEVLHEYNML